MHIRADSHLVMEKYMKENIEYQIFIGCKDAQIKNEIIKELELREMITQFFARRRIDFSILSAKGGFLHEDGRFEIENTLCINIIGTPDLDIVKLAKGLSMFMNQECSLIVRNALKMKFQ